VRYCSLPEQQTLRTTLGEVPHVLAPGKIRPPALIVVGDVVAAQAEMNWFTSRPLFGKTVVVTRPEHQVDDITHRLTELGATALVQPAIRIDPVANFEAVDAAIKRLHEFDWLVFSSANGVKHFLDRIEARGDDLRQLAGCRLAAIGPGTAAALADYHLRADLVPREYRAEALSESLIASGEVAAKRFLLLRASRGREVLAERLTAAGADVEQVVVYLSTDITQPTEEVAEALAAGRVDWITVTSSAIARALVALLGQELGKTKLAAISPLTAGVLADAGYPPNVVADVYTAEGLLAAILNAEACETN
jgi:uroporphyrinogen III methyltransferase/synthase